jgi:hypothetical protein
MDKKQPLSYQAAGVDSGQKDQAMELLGNWVERSLHCGRAGHCRSATSPTLLTAETEWALRFRPMA